MTTFILKKVYCCSCLMHLINQIDSANIRCYTEILQAINKLCEVSSSQIYCLHMEEKTRCIVLCRVHFTITMMSEMNYDCTSQTEKDYYFECLQNRFCVSCVRHYCKSMCSIDPFMVLVSKSFVFFLVVFYKNCLKSSKYVIVFWILLNIVCIQMLILLNFEKNV